MKSVTLVHKFTFFSAHRAQIFKKIVTSVKDILLSQTTEGILAE